MIQFNPIGYKPSTVSPEDADESFLTPISSIFEGQSPEELLNYQNKLGIPLSENKFYAGYVSGNVSKKSPQKKKKKEPYKSIKKEVPIKMPEFTKKPPYKETSFNPMDDRTIKNQVDMADTTYEGKKKFMEEIGRLNLKGEDADFLIKLAEKESSFRPNVKNKLGYLGYYQFGDSALSTIGRSRKDFRDPAIQHEAALKLADLNLIPLKKYIGKKVNGITLTKNALRAAAHLAGATGTKDWIEGTKKSSFAKRGFVDANGTHITKYLQEFK